ncbi:MAG TPA: helix-turn-helix domain-containing protein, partial [bacterium]|nr:helix-turn-helix domain-containing protein [bacterium]
LGRATLHRWLKRHREQGLIGLNDRSRRPHQVRRPTTAWPVTARLVELRKEYPAGSQYKQS